jgi:hypothetical protein
MEPTSRAPSPAVTIPNRPLISLKQAAWHRA